MGDAFLYWERFFYQVMMTWPLPVRTPLVLVGLEPELNEPPPPPTPALELPPEPPPE